MFKHSVPVSLLVLLDICPYHPFTFCWYWVTGIEDRYPKLYFPQFVSLHLIFHRTIKCKRAFLYFFLIKSLLWKRQLKLGRPTSLFHRSPAKFLLGFFWARAIHCNVGESSNSSTEHTEHTVTTQARYMVDVLSRSQFLPWRSFLICLPYLERAFCCCSRLLRFPTYSVIFDHMVALDRFCNIACTLSARKVFESCMALSSDGNNF